MYVLEQRYYNDLRTVSDTMLSMAQRIAELEAMEIPVGGGVGNHTILDATVHTDSALQAVSQGSLIYGNKTPLWDELLIGANGTFLASNGADPGWRVLAVGDIPAHNLLSTTHGDTVANGATRGSLVYGNATPSWDELTHPGGTNYHLQTDANDVLWRQDLYMNDGTFIGISGDVRTLYDSSNGHIDEILNAAADEWRVYQGGAAVAKIDGNGNGYFAGNVGVGTTTPLSTESGIDIASGGLSLVLGAFNASSDRIDNTNKVARIACIGYDIDAAPFTLLYSAGLITSNIVAVGGGTGLTNAATELRFYTAANTTTTTGTERMRIGPSGDINILNDLKIGGSAGDNPAYPLEIYQGSTTLAKAAVGIEQKDIDEPFLKLIGTAAAADLTRSIVAVGDVTTATVAGYVKIEVQDDGNQITDQDYFAAIYTLA